MSPIYVVGHKNPDTDSICSAIAYAYLRNKMVEAGKIKGVTEEAVPARQGDLNPETEFVLQKFGFDAPELVTDGEGKKVILVDHSEKAQSLDNIEKAEIIAIIDHHKIGDITTPNPITFINMPTGCTASIIKKLFEYCEIEIPQNIAGIMLAAILSDTVAFKSVTTTEKDKQAAEDLAKIAGIDDMMAFAMEMFKAKSDVSGKSPRDLLFRDYKDFDMSGNKVGVGQIEVVSLDLLADVKDALYEEMKKVKEEGGYHSIFLMLTDIMKEGTELLVVTDDPSIVEKAFGKKLEGRSVWLDGVMSRKKQVVPPLEKAFA
ncbi:manganese-dependent inorganic pyrophosphatase [Archaeoglobus veneficus]|uniref:inorganic diphosphatase n=1 Tax=Archaeoglobus veneficus (strain DSM 11195 / SNP6) TaxID=693661 RepID=F2KSH1_ARCVS|nr:manganese-dependent inorganic pyrophosphatase [Archaeoglobus veneficus]AEA46940.1 Inorganic diphosphatase [Archaeoglobus veneficus SNP6]